MNQSLGILAMPPLAVVWERFYPIALGVVAGGVCLLCHGQIACVAAIHHWHFDGLYAAVLGLVSITTGFLATFYATVQSTSTSFIDRIRSSTSFRTFIRYTRRAIVLGFFLSIATVPLLLIQPELTQEYGARTVAVAVWVGATVWTLASFYRVAALMFLLFESQAVPRRPGG